MKMQTSGEVRREIAKLYPPSLRAKRSNPPLHMPRYGLLRFARNDVGRPRRTGCPPSSHDEKPQNKNGGNDPAVLRSV